MFSFSQGNTINISRSIRKCKKPSIFENFLVVESFFWSNYRLIVQSSDYILKWLHQECVLGNLPLGLFRSSRPQPSIFENFSRKYWWWSPSFGYIADWLFRVAIIYQNGSTKNVFLEIFRKILECLNIIDCKYLR